MSNQFSSIPIRSNANTGLVDASWWNTIRTALINFMGAGAIDETQFTIADNQSGYQNITGLLLDASVTRAVAIHYTIYRSTGAVERREMGVIWAFYKALATAWSFEVDSYGDDSLGNGTVSVPLNVTSAGQVQYKSDSMGGSYSGKMRYKAVISFITET